MASPRIPIDLAAAASAALRAGFAALDMVWPKDPRLVAFGHRDFTDNSRALFEHLSLPGGPLRAVWLTEDEAQAATIAAAVPGAWAVPKRSARGLLLALRASAVALSFYPEEFRPFSLASRRKRVVMLWHAISIKGSKMLNPLLTDGARRRRARTGAGYAMMIASSGMDRLAKAAAHGIDAGKVAVTGLPRTDRLVRPAMPHRPLPPAVSRALAGRTILYAPTYRAGGRPTELLPFVDADPDRFHAFLAANDVSLLFRPHKNDRAAIAAVAAAVAAGADRIILASPDVVPDVADLLGRTDVLVTDHSSIFLDFLLVDRPIVFVPHERDGTPPARGLLYDYDAITPGPKPRSQRAFEAALRDAFAGAPEHAAHRAWARAMFHAHDDGRATVRVAQELQRVMGVRTGAPARSAARLANPILRPGRSPS